MRPARSSRNAGPAVARSLVPRSTALAQDLAEYLTEYNYDRAHTGRIIHGRVPADIVYGACRVVNEQGGTLAQALAAMPEVTKHFDAAAIARMTDPANYCGLAPQMVDRVIASAKR